MSGDDVELEVKGRVYTHGSNSGTTGHSISLPCCRRPFSVSSKFRRSVCREVGGRKMCGRGPCGLASSGSPSYRIKGEKGKKEWTKELD